MNRGRVVVLLEGASDVAALRVLLSGTSLAEVVDLVDMRGVTNVRRFVDDVLRGGDVVRLLGLCDEAEQAYVAQALVGAGADLRASEPADLGFHVCHADLEDELIRALGPERTVTELAKVGLATRFAQFRQQPAWRGRPLSQQLRRFAGVASGRKALLAEAFTRALSPAEIPPPLAALLAQLEAAVADSDHGPPVRPFPRSSH